MAQIISQFNPVTKWSVISADNGYEYLDYQFEEVDKTHTKVTMSIITDAGLSKQGVIDEIKKVESNTTKIPLSKIYGKDVSIGKTDFNLESLATKEFIITHPEKLVDGWEIKIGTASATIGTTTDVDVIDNSSARYIHYANGYYWALLKDKNVYSSSDGSTWNTQTDAFTFTMHTQGALYRFSGNNVIAAGKKSNNFSYYRQGTLDSDGDITWGTERLYAASSSRSPRSLQKDSSGYPIGFNADAYCYLNDQTDGQGTWTAYDGTKPSWENSVAALFIAPDASRDMVGIYCTGNGNKPSAIVFDNSTTTWGSVTEIKTDWPSYTHQKNGLSAVKLDNSEIHMLDIDSGGRIDHSKRAGTTPWAWSTVSSDITSLTSHTKLTLSTDGTDIWIFYDKGDEKIYWRKYDGTWGSESTLKSGTDAIQGAISCYEDVVNDEIGIIWVQDTGGSGSPYDVVFDTISVGVAGLSIPIAMHHYTKNIGVR